MIKLPVINNTKIPCTTCVSTIQMRESQYCTKTIIMYEGQYVPECMVNILELDQEQRNFLTCGTYNLGVYSVCKTCPLSCPQNSSKKSNQFNNIIDFISNLLGFDEQKKKEISKVLEQLNTSDFKEIYLSLDRASSSIKDVLGGKTNSSDMTKKILEYETNNIKKTFNTFIQNGKITEKDIEILKNNIDSEKNISKLKTLISSLKQS